MLLILLGDGVFVANVSLKKSKGENAGWIVITIGWAIAGLLIPVYIFGPISGVTTLNPAVTIAFASIGQFFLGRCSFMYL